MRRLLFEPVVRGRRHLVLRYGVDDLGFSTTYWYDDVDFPELEAGTATSSMRRVYFHLLAFEANKAASLAPAAFDSGPYADLVTEPFWDLWETVFHHVWGVWRYENDLPDYRLPRPAGPASATARRSGEVVGGRASAHALRRRQGQPGQHETARAGGIAYDAFVYSHSTYGRGRSSTT